MRFLNSGKVKDVYDLEDGTLLFRFSDRVSAYDVKFTQTIPRKGEVLCKFAQYWFDKLPGPNHFVGRTADTEMVVRRMEMIPMECVVRGYLYGSLMGRYRKGSAILPEGTRPVLAARLPKPVFDPTTKSEHDVPVDRGAAIRDGLVTERQYDELESASISIYEQMAAVADGAGFILADLKLEFGVLDGELCLGDSIGPDEYRLWPKEAYREGRTQEAYDKQILRDWLTEEGWAQRFEEERAAGRDPRPPEIPSAIIEKMTARYVSAYERIAGRDL